MPSKTFAGISVPIETAPEPVEAPPATEAKPKRARTDKGQFQGDDPATTDKDEAWVEG